jgi:transposase-like protein
MKFSKEEKAMWLEDWKQSGKKAWTYAKENGLIPQTFCSWVKREEKKASGFVEIPIRKKPKPELPQEILVEKGDIKIHIPMSVWIEYPSVIAEGLKAVL